MQGKMIDRLSSAEDTEIYIQNAIHYWNGI